jgi:hypothetical protein
VSGAAVLDFVGYTLTGERFTNEKGEVDLPKKPGQSRSVFIVPRDGSFAFSRVDDLEELAVTIPPPRATIIVRSVDTEGQPLSRIWLVMRFNGIALPFEVQQSLVRQQGAVTVSGNDGNVVLRSLPLGAYEFWPVGSVAEVRAVMSGLGKDAPVVIAAAPGLNEAVMTFSPVTDAP